LIESEFFFLSFFSWADFLFPFLESQISPPSLAFGIILQSTPQRESHLTEKKEDEDSG
jgi:hypothetical protein